MPSGPPELHEKWCNAGPYVGHGDSNALRLLAKGGLKPNRGGMFLIPAERTLSGEEISALDYLAWEWDYASEIVNG